METLHTVDVKAYLEARRGECRLAFRRALDCLIERNWSGPKPAAAWRRRNPAAVAWSSPLRGIPSPLGRWSSSASATWLSSGRRRDTDRSKNSRSRPGTSIISMVPGGSSTPLCRRPSAADPP